MSTNKVGKVRKAKKTEGREEYELALGYTTTALTCCCENDVADTRVSIHEGTATT